MNLDALKSLAPAILIGAYRTMYASRRLDEKEIALKRQGRAYFQVSCAGHEAVLVAAGLVLRPGEDWVFAYYRDRALCLHLGITPHEQLLSAVAAADDPSSGGRQMPCHWSSPKLNIVSGSACTGTQFVQAVGAAEAGYRYSLIDKIHDATSKFASDEIVYVSSGDGATSEGEFWESLNTACNLKLPILYLIQDNGYAISVPTEVQTAGGSISRLVRSFPNLHVEECDGTDLLASYEALIRAASHCREHRGPAFVHAHVVRLYSHSDSDDDRLYRPAEERAKDAASDPIPAFETQLLNAAVVTSDQLQRLRDEVDAEINRAADLAITASQPSKNSATLYLYSPNCDPSSKLFDSEDETQPAASQEGYQGTMVDLINRCLRDEMRRDPCVVVFGQDVADAGRSEHLQTLKGKGGVFKVTANLQREFGDARVFNAPIAEASIIGRAMGMAIRGLKPVVEIQFFDYIWPAYMQLHNEVSALRWRSNNQWKCPMVVRVPIGGYLRGGAIYHCQSGVSLLAALPGLRVVMPSTALDANGLLRTAIRCDDPILFLEHKHLYRQRYNRGHYPSANFMIPFGKAKVVREGSDVSIITYGALVQRALVAAERVGKNGISVEVIDLRSLKPYDWCAIELSVRKTNRVVVAYEDPVSWGYGAEIAARIASDLFDYLDAPLRRVAALDTFVGYAPNLEEATLPDEDDLTRTILETAHY